MSCYFLRTLNMGVVGSSETSMYFFQTAQLYIIKGSTFHT
jgi:hypothetical protein